MEDARVVRESRVRNYVSKTCWGANPQLWTLSSILPRNNRSLYRKLCFFGQVCVWQRVHDKKNVFECMREVHNSIENDYYGEYKRVYNIEDDSQF